MKAHLSIAAALGKRTAESPLEGLGMLFPHGTPARRIESVREAAPQQARSAITTQQFMSGFYDLAIGGQNIVSRTEAWRNPHVRRSVEATSQAIASLPFVIYDGEKPLKKHWWLDFVQHPNELLQMSEHDLKEQTVAVRELMGETFWFLERQGERTLSGKKAPIANIWIYHPHAVTEAIDQHSHDQLGWVFQFETERFFVDRSDVVHFRRYDPMRHNPRRPSRGTSALDAALLAVSTDTAANRYNLDYFSRGFAPGVILVTKDGVQMEAGTEERLADKLRAGNAGKNGGIAVVDGSEVGVVQLSTSQKDAEFSNAKSMAENDIGEVFGVPPCVRGNQGQKYDNAEMQLLLWWDGPLANIRSNLCAAINNGPLKKEPTITCDLDTRGVAVLQSRRLAAVDKYIALVAARHTPKAAAEITGVDVDPSMPGYDKVYLSFSQIPYELAEEGQSVSISKADVLDPALGAAPDSGAPTVTPPPVATTQPAQIADAAPRMVRVVVPDTEAPRERPRITVAAPVKARAASDTDLLDELLGIIGKDTAKLKAKAAQYQTAAYEAGAEQIASSLGSETVLGIDDPRIVSFLEARGNLIESVPETVAAKINDKIASLIEQGTSPEDIGRIIRGEFNHLTDVQARLIARQEVGSALNGGRWGQMQEEGVDAREWLTSKDGNVRESHEAVDGEIVEGFEEKYSNGLLYPQDPEGEADEVINCRCVELPASGASARSRVLTIVAQRVALVEVRAAKIEAERQVAMYLKKLKASDERSLAHEHAAHVARLRAAGVIDGRTGYWRAVVQAKNVRIIERQLGDAMKALIFGWRKPVLELLASKGVAK